MTTIQSELIENSFLRSRSHRSRARQGTVDEGLCFREVVADAQGLAIHDDGRVAPRSMADRGDHALDRGCVDHLDMNARPVPLHEAANPVREPGVLEREVRRQGARGLLAPDLLAETDLAEGDLAVLAVRESRGRIRDDLHRHHLATRVAPPSRTKKHATTIGPAQT